MTILEKMKKQCAEAGYYETKNIEKIAKAKQMMFGKDEWQRCPCDGNNPERYCISSLCKKDIAEKGICHCNCYKKEPVDLDKDTPMCG